MFEFIKFVFSSLFIWLGFIIAIGVACDGIAKIIRAIRK